MNNKQFRIMKKHKRTVIGMIVSILLLIPAIGMCGKVTDYGFEDWVGFNGDASPAPSYIYSTNIASVWERHRDSTIVTTGGPSCENNTAYEGNYYHHIQFNTTTPDPCLGRTSATVNSYTISGYSNTYPLGTKDETHYGSTFVTDTQFLRFYFRTTDDWTSAQTGIDNGGGLKFIRWAVGQDYFHDDTTVLVKLRNNGDDLYPSFSINTTKSNLVRPNINWQDGEWHAFVLKVVRTSTQGYTTSIYLDDWDMENPPLSTQVRVVNNPGNGKLHMFTFGGNWSAKYPPNLMGMDFDKIEVWDGDVVGSTTPVPTPTAPTPPSNFAIITQN